MIWFLSMMIASAEELPAGLIEVPAGEVLDLSEWESPPDFEEVILGRDAQIKLPEFHSYRIKKLVAKDGARIEVAHQSSGGSGVDSVDGGHGADAIFFIDHLDGHLLIESRGGDGGHGRDGRHGRQGLIGKKGRDAFKLFFFMIGDGDDGGAGEPGEDGADGDEGGRGGDGGNVRVYFQTKSSQSNIMIDVAGGQGGMGGRAGLGGLGGPGGPGGRGWRSGSQGPMGVSGKDGRPGRPGEPGRPGTAQVVQVDAALYQCLVQDHLLFDGEEMRECFTQ